MMRPILLASDGSRGSLGALRLAAEISRESGKALHVVTVMEPFARYRVDTLGTLPEAWRAHEQLQAQELRLAVERQVMEVVGPEWDVTVDVEVGRAAPCIVATARRLSADSVIVGAGPRTPLDGWMRSETALEVARLAHRPVLAVPPNLRELPSRALVAVDFSRYSLRAARAALGVMGERAHLFLAHVTDQPGGTGPFTVHNGWEETYEIGARSRLEELADELRADGARVEVGILHGDPARQLLGLAERLHVELIAAGTHGSGFFGRIAFGSVSTRLLRGWRGMTLLAPSGRYPRELTTTHRNSDAAVATL
jgi:nucleotide-binding universal stress UspA family protein